jgi:diguanylate cyclase (GGDEF)-like protein
MGLLVGWIYGAGVRWHQEHCRANRPREAITPVQINVRPFFRGTWAKRPGKNWNSLGFVAAGFRPSLVAACHTGIMSWRISSFGVVPVAIGLGQASLCIATALALWSLGVAFLPYALAIGLGLGALNAGLFVAHRWAQAEQKSSRRLNLLAEMNVQVNREILLNGDIELIYRTILNYLFRIFDTAATGSVLILGDDGYLRFAASKGFTDEFVSSFKLRLEDSFLYQLTQGQIKSARLFIPEDFERLETVFKPEKWEYKSVISAPIYVGDRLFGLLSLDSAVAGTYDELDVEVVERFRTQIEVGLLARERYTANIKRYQVDSLTGLLTRRYFEDLVKLSMERAQRYGEALVIALIDVDGLKTINDTLGHLAGDQLLLTIANALQVSCRNSDIMGRLGGDEFIAAYHRGDTSAIEANLVDIRAQLSARRLNFEGADYRGSFSFGVARFPQDGINLDALVAVADKRMYAMKAERK